MENLTDTQIQKIANSMSNPLYHWNTVATKQLIDLFDKISTKPLDDIKSYIKMYDDSFYTYKTFEELINSEKEQSDGLTEIECKNEINHTIWELPCGWYVQYV